MMPVQALSTFMVMAQNSWPSIETVLGLLESDDGARETRSGHVAAVPQATNLALEARNLSFSYRPDLPPVLDGVSFVVPAGKITGLVARKGQGKTTFFRLVLRFYDPLHGQILIGGLPTTDLSRDEVRDRVTMMSQFPAFFHDTLRENLRIARPGATDPEIESHCRRTGIWPVLEQNVGSQEEKHRQPNPLDRQFAAGMTLSGGQRKLLALTRCLLRSPDYLLLDEPTVGMDRLEEFGLMDDLRSACAGRTVMVVNHDVRWLLRFCDYFIVLDQGKIVQRGGRELASQSGLFKMLLEADDRTSSLSASAAVG
jgi:ATP-binding cassette subfamily B protein